MKGIRDLITKHPETSLAKLFAPAERRTCEAQADPFPHFAARFAAKEAVFKALGTRWSKGISWEQVEITRRRSGAPLMRLSGAVRRRIERMGGTRILKSIAYTGDLAIAFVLLHDKQDWKG